MDTIDTAYGTRQLCRADNLTSRAELCYGREEYLKAITHLRNALKMKEKILGPDHPNLVCTLRNLATVYIALANAGVKGTIDNAITQLKRAASIHRKQHPDGRLGAQAAVTLVSLAILYRRIGKLQTAERHLWRACEIRLRVVGPASALVTEVLDELISLHVERGYNPGDVAQRATELWQNLKRNNQKGA